MPLCKRCGSVNTRAISSKERERYIVTCLDCGFWYWSGSQLYGFRNRRTLVKSFFNHVITSKTFFLDVGCGLGIDVIECSKTGAFSIGVDVDKSSIKYSKRKAKRENLHKRTAFIVADGYYLPFKNGSFDVILCADVIEHLVRPSSLLGEVARVSRGFVSIATPTDKSIFHRLYYKLINFDRAHDKAHIQWFSQRDVLTMLKGLGFKALKVFGIYNMPIPPFVVEHSHLRSTFERLDATFGQTPMKAFAYSTVVICKKKTVVR